MRDGFRLIGPATPTPLGGTARAEDTSGDWAALIVAGQRTLTERGVNLSAGLTGIGQGLLSSAGRPGMARGGKFDVRLGA